MAYDRKRAAEMVLALMYLDVHEDVRAWKGYPWDVLDFLFEAGLITDPARKAKSVALTNAGVAEATRCFNELLAIGSPKVKGKPKRAGTDLLPDVQRAQIDALLGPFCAPHSDPSIAAKVRLGFHVDGASVVLFESRPSYTNGDVWHEHPVAKFHFTKSRASWQLYCRFRDLKWYAYEPLPESRDLADLVSEVQEDPAGIFWGWVT